MYSHTQRGYVVIAICVATVPFVLASTLPVLPLSAAVSCLVIATVLVLFSSLTITVDQTRVVAAFGPGLVRFGWDREDIVGVAPIRTRFIAGYGIRYMIGRGWLFNVSGLDAVAVSLKNGRTIHLGTDDVDGLVAALERDLPVHSGQA